MRVIDCFCEFTLYIGSFDIFIERSLTKNMVKFININASFNNQTHIFECDQHDFLKKVAEYFDINMRDVELYAVKKGGQRCRIKPHEITDLMKIEIVPKSTVKRGNQRQLCSNGVEESLQEKFIENIIIKLTRNTSLTGLERTSMIELLQSYSGNFSKKRKIGEDNSRPEVANRKVQVDMSITNRKDSFAQTDLVFPVPREVQNNDEAISYKLKRLAGSTDVDKDEVVMRERLLMRDSFDDRRNFIILKSPPVSLVKDKYPQLFTLAEVKNEMGRIFYMEKCEDFISNMHKYAPLIVPKALSSDELFRRTQKSIERAHTDIQKNYAKCVGSVFILNKIMEEQCRFIHLQDFPHSSEDIYPHIDASAHSLKELFFDNLLFPIIVEGKLLCEATNFLEAVMCLMASFFIFNIDYPESCRRTLIMFEKLYLNANDTEDLDQHTEQMLKLFNLEAKTNLIF